MEVALPDEADSLAAVPQQEVDKHSLELVGDPPCRNLDHHAQVVGMGSQAVAHSQAEDHNQVVHPYRNHNLAADMGAHTLEAERQVERRILVARHSSLDAVAGNHMDWVEGNHTEVVHGLEAVRLPSLFQHHQLHFHLEVEDILLQRRDLCRHHHLCQHHGPYHYR